MELTESQKNEVAAWFAAGASLDEIQKRIKSEFGIHMTYLDVRLLVAELPQPVEAGEADGMADGVEAGTTGTSKASGRKPPEYDQGFADGPDSQGFADGPDGQEEQIGEAARPPLQQENASEEDSTEAQTVSAPTVTIDSLMIPGTIASGDVTFSDGQTGKWFLDQMGRLGLGGNLPQGYRPSPTDAALFQQQLMGLLQSKGLC